MNKRLDCLWNEINSIIIDLEKACKKPNFEQMQILTKKFKRQITKSKNYIKNELKEIDNLVPDKLLEYSQFINGLFAAINHVCSDFYCPKYKNDSKAEQEICSDLKIILKIEVVNELNILLSLVNTPLKKTTKLPLYGGKKSKRKQTRKRTHRRRRTNRTKTHKLKV